MRTHKSVTLPLLAVALLFTPLVSLAQRPATADRAHTPHRGSTEEQSILKSLHIPQSVYIQVNYLKVHQGWAWADVTPLDGHRKPVAEGGTNLVHLKSGHWTAFDLSKVPADPNDPMGAEDASAGFVKNLRKQFPGVPADIFPKPGH